MHDNAATAADNDAAAAVIAVTELRHRVVVGTGLLSHHLAHNVSYSLQHHSRLVGNEITLRSLLPAPPAAVRLANSSADFRAQVVKGALQRGN